MTFYEKINDFSIKENTILMSLEKCKPIVYNKEKGETGCRLPL